MSAAARAGQSVRSSCGAAYRRSLFPKCPQQSDDDGQRVEERVDVGVGRRPAHAGPQRAVGVDAHRGQHRRRFERLARARRPRVHRHAALVEREQDRFRLHAVDPEAHEVGEARVGVAVALDAGNAPRSRRRRAARSRRALARLRRRRPDDRRAAAPKPTMAGTSSIPARRARSCAPPTTNGGKRRPRRTSSAAAPFGPPELVARSPSRGRRRARAKSTATWPAAAHASTWTTASLRARTAATTSAAGCSVPTSWLASCTDTSAVSGRIAAATASGVEPSAPVDADDGDVVGAARRTASSTDECSTAVVTTWPPPLRVRSAPHTAVFDRLGAGRR